MPVDYLKETPSQTAGPYVHIGTLPAAAGLPLRTQENLHVLAQGAAAGERIRLEGVIHDGAGAPVKDAMLEIWQADASGRYNAPGFSGWGRTAADFKTGEWFFETVKPGPTPWRDGRLQAPHVSLLIFARGINIHLHTRAYFSDETAANEADPVLRAIEQRNRVPTLIAQRSTRGGQTVYRFDVWLQHDERETVFFDM
ncbi:MAG: protocatechuate 3,4-dioxygenase subunit alpha [Methylobacteriaceae bacterium]|nr:protocatechuate 3,4-dioxygenase subunit alpha [Methylobacteriaceae bacterium]